MGEERESLPEILDRLAAGLRRCAVAAFARSPEALFDEPEDLNLVIELRERIVRSTLTMIVVEG
jgi:hypothetical protein